MRAVKRSFFANTTQGCLKRLFCNTVVIYFGIPFFSCVVNLPLNTLLIAFTLNKYLPCDFAVRHLFCLVKSPPGTMQCRCGCRLIVCPQVCRMAIIPVCTPSHFASLPKQFIVSHTASNKMLYMVAGWCKHN